MPTFDLRIEAILENISSISAPNDYSWSFEFECGACGEKSPKPVTFTADHKVDLTRGGKATLQLKCKFCERMSDVSLLDGEHVYTASGEMTTFATLECRGTSPSTWNVIEPLTMTGEKGYIFDDSEIENGEFFGYNEDQNQEASVTEFKYDIVRKK
eukprot:Plantae.Rhodophyta-Purpureofilum_apyrenoidigerum.ctg8683.p1 GENE.Plantae.Rhodophyta-Purpureofilum_apyrenoidigerum.ctg8683~~Plantae.Rhodophyta-Purpureofilum_apyrenoidigerum.ctg8683.p1  ORF type:complete len:156 (-),score=33.27 Plantae.Rhodophyta-Purpureofilum_apyrenoidigerum.ctg8683:144-611(-)